MSSIGRTQQIGRCYRQTNDNVTFSRRELELYTIQELNDVLEYLAEHGNRGARRLVLKVLHEKQHEAEVQKNLNLQKD
jgi:hypothetical protein